MEFIFLSFLSQPIVVAAFTLLCCAIGVFAVRLFPRKSQSWGSVSGRIGISAESDFASTKEAKSCGDCGCSCDGAVLKGGGSEAEKVANGGVGEMCEKKGTATAVVVERQTGASMMEQLVPEITTHALSYLDYPSLCRLSMTNSLMRKAANDDNAWKALYHKDFTMEQTSVKPADGWKAYYAATRAIVNVNAEFFDIIRERALPAMSRFWLDADYVKCIHASGELFTGYNAVMESWQMAFNWDQQPDAFQVLDVRVRVLTDMAWVTMKSYADMDAGPYNVTNVFEHHNGQWYLVHHHCSVTLVDGGVNQQIVHA